MKPASFLLQLLFLALILPMAAEAEDLGRYSVSPPAGWTVNRTATLDHFDSPGSATQIFVVAQKHDGDFNDLVEMWTGDEIKYRVDERGRSFFFQEKSPVKDERGWVRLTDDGGYLLVSVSHPFEGMAAFIDSFRAAAGQKGLTSSVEALKSRPVRDWLSFKSKAL